MFPLKFFVLRKLKSFHIHRTKTTSQQHDKKKTTKDNENKKKTWGITIGTLCLVLFRICLDTRLKVFLIALESFSTEKKNYIFSRLTLKSTYTMYLNRSLAIRPNHGFTESTCDTAFVHWEMTCFCNKNNFPFIQDMNRTVINLNANTILFQKLTTLCVTKESSLFLMMSQELTFVEWYQRFKLLLSDLNFSSFLQLEQIITKTYFLFPIVLNTTRTYIIRVQTQPIYSHFSLPRALTWASKIGSYVMHQNPDYVTSWWSWNIHALL